MSQNNRIAIIAGSFILLCVYFWSRLTNLTILPIFTDEAIYIRWSQIGSQDANWRFISLTDGKQPLFTWIMMVLLRFFPDPLYAGRLVSVLAGTGTLFGVIILSWMIFRSWRTSLIAGLFYVVVPFFVVYDRLAVYDSLVATFSVWTVISGLVLVRTLRFDAALILGFLLGGGMLNKTSGFINLYLQPLLILLFPATKNSRIKKIIIWIILIIVSTTVSQGMYSILRLSPFFHIISQKDTVFVYPFSEWITHPFRFVEGNLRGLFDWLRGYLTIPIFFLAFGHMLFLYRLNREKLFLYAWWIVPFVGLATFGKVLYPRFILFMTIPLIILSAYSMDKIMKSMKHVRFSVILLLFAIVPALYTDSFLLYNPQGAPIPKSDRDQLLDDWPSGWGIAPSVDFLRKEADKGPIGVFTEGTFGLLPYSIEIYLVDNPNVTIVGIWPIPKELPPYIAQSVREKPTYFILDQAQQPPSAWPLTLIAEYPKAGDLDRKLRLYRIMGNTTLDETPSS